MEPCGLGLWRDTRRDAVSGLEDGCQLFDAVRTEGGDFAFLGVSYTPVKIQVGPVLKQA